MLGLAGGANSGINALNAINAGSDAFNSTTFLANNLWTPAADGAIAGANAAAGQALGAFSAMAPYAALIPALSVVGPKVIKPLVRGLTGFGAKEDAKRAELAKWSEQSGLDDYKSMVESVSGMPYGDYIESKRPPLSPYDADLQALRNSGAGDMSYEEDELATRYQYGAGKQSMDNFYASNPDWYTPTGERIYPEGKLGDMDRQSAAWFAGGRQGQNPMSGTINNVINRNDYPILSRSRNGLL